MDTCIILKPSVILRDNLLSTSARFMFQSISNSKIWPIQLHILSKIKLYVYVDVGMGYASVLYWKMLASSQSMEQGNKYYNCYWAPNYHKQIKSFLTLIGRPKQVEYAAYFSQMCFSTNVYVKLGRFWNCNLCAHAFHNCNSVITIYLLINYDTISNYILINIRTK